MGKTSLHKGVGFEGRFYKDTCHMFERMEIVEAIYEGGAPSKNTQRSEAKCSSYVRKKKGGASASPFNPDKGCANKRKINDAGHPSYVPTRAKKHACCMSPCILQKSVNSLKDTPRSAPRSIQTSTSKPDTLTTSVPIPSSSKTQRKRLTPWKIMMNPPQKRRR